MGNNNVTTQYNDPFLGYDSFKASQDDCVYTSQAEALARLLMRQNLFISGAAGTGKGYVISKFIARIRESFGDIFNVDATASTGLAASLLDQGRTIHSWSHLGIFNDVFTVEKYQKYMARSSIPGFKASKNSTTLDNIRYCDTLIVDEVSMLPAYFIDNLDAMCKWVRGNNKPFGGIQIVFVGDFSQLPPVIRNEQRQNPKLNVGLAIESKAWKEAGIKHLYLDKAHRAKDDNLKHLLNTIVDGSVNNDPRSQELLNQCLQRKPKPDVSYAKLFTKNINVDRYNQKCLDAEPGALKVFPSRNLYGSAKDCQKLRKENRIPEKLTLRVGATVIVTTNIVTNGGKIVASNGTIGTVLSYLPEGGVLIKTSDGQKVAIHYTTVRRVEKASRKKDDGEVEVVYNQKAGVDYLPLALGYAITVHKSQGQTFDAVSADLSECFTKGLGYVALSRVTNLDNLVITGLSPRALEMSDKTRAITKAIRRKAKKHRDRAKANQDVIDTILSSSMILELYWDKENAGSVLAASKRNMKINK